MKSSDIDINRLISEFKTFVLNSQFPIERDLIISEFENTLLEYYESLEEDHSDEPIEFDSKGFDESAGKYDHNKKALAVLLSVYEVFILPYEVINETEKLLNELNIDAVRLEEGFQYTKGVNKYLEQQKTYFSKMGSELFPQVFNYNDFQK